MPRFLVLLCGLFLLVQPARAEVARGRDGIVSSVDPLATAAGVEAFRQGGNAIDAAVAVALTLGVTDGANSGIGGGCFMLIRRANGEIVALDGREMAPAAATRDMYVKDGKAHPELSQTGALAIGIPGSLAVYEYAVKSFGARTFGDALRPAAELAEQGFPLSKPAAGRLASVAKELWGFPANRDVFFHPDGTPFAAGETLQQRDLAASYRGLAEHGTAWFYRDPFPQKVAEWMARNGGLITAEDFARYTMKSREPIRTKYRGYDIVSFPPPSSGGVHVAQILNILEGYDIARLTDADRLHMLAEAMKLAFADRAFWLGDPDFVPVPRGLIDPAYAAGLRTHISMDHATPVEAHGTPPEAETRLFEKHTTHFCTADRAGNWVACTTTVNTTYGSKVMIPGTGIVLNNQMDDFSIQPGVANAFKLIGGEANAVAPGKRPLSSMSPTIVLQNGRPVLALGAAGGPTIITQTVINLVGVLDLHLPLDAALAQPRFHQQWAPDELRVEDTLPPPIADSLRARGHKLVHGAGGASQIIGVEPQTGELLGASEPRLPSKAAGFGK
ncbi:MAG TPA: gamma-glutamyltransferase [Chthoniobacteraceae bacterium]|jgi:gamma-glutamyltranspeptidase/glutathione hydrolase|nr:gamma-glutamyltransferase [Chthoniobacteraceae bacterium]